MTQQDQKRIGNVGLLDLRNATAESLAPIAGVNNVGFMVTSRETASLVAKMSTGNVGALAIAPADATLINGPVTFSAGYLGNGDKPLSLIVNGRLVVEADVSAQDIEEGVQTLVINGDVICPKPLESAILLKIAWNNGQVLTYNEGDILAPNRFVLDRPYLESLDDGSSLVVARGFSAPDVLPNDLLKRKIRSIAVGRSAQFHAENADLLRSRIVNLTGRLRLRVIPEGFQLVDMPLDIDDAMLRSLEAAKLQVEGRVVIERGVDPALLDSGISALAVRDLLICPVELRDVIAAKCDLLSTRAVFYQGELWFVESEMELVPSRFEFLDGAATLIVTGDLVVSPDVEPKTLADRLDRVHNLGDIYCSQAQMGAIQARLGISEGDFLDSRPDASAIASGNFGYLAL
ncbi:MAG: hypothetical protein FI707_06740 [SAR202 cluster bacterium]|nr:hypothetical protein [SAR202 cluster bacterium]MQG68471.1 hypothetical protein [SAR202 cluster bacterium]|tara:strand:+ start:260 stop:1471 length:1212 start_codon:yes stop_codon:yes gene_type:complete